MPETPLDRILALGTLVTAAALVVMVATNWEAFSGSATTAAVPAAVVAPTETFDDSEPLVPAPRETLARREETAPARPVPAAKPALVIAATRGASWLEVRAGDSGGEELYYGILEEGARTELERLPVWIRLGAAESVDIRLSGARVKSLPVGQNGVVQLVASAGGVTAAPEG